MKDLPAPADATIKQAVITSMDMKAFDLELLSQVLVAYDHADASAFLTVLPNKILAVLADLVVDVPMATKNCGRIFADLIVAGKAQSLQRAEARRDCRLGATSRGRRYHAR